jgi:GTP-binding protein
LRKALEARLAVVLVVNKVDRPDARPQEVVDEVYELFLDLDANDDQIDFPICYVSAKQGWASNDPELTGTDLEPLFKMLLEHVPEPLMVPDHPLQAQVTNLDADPYVGRLAMCRVHNGTIRRGQRVMWCRADGSEAEVRVSELFVTERLQRVPVESAEAGELIAVGGIDDITIGETLADLDDPRSLPLPIIDEPSLSVTIGVNTSPLAGREGKKVTARLIKSRLDAELVGNVAIRVLPTERPDTWEVQGRGELQLAVLVELMRREGFELTVGKPQVVTRIVEGKVHEPIEHLTIDLPEDHIGAVTQMMGVRRAELCDMVNHGTGWARLEYRVPARGLIGFRTEFLTETRGTGTAHHVFDGYAAWKGEIRSRNSGSLVNDRAGAATGYALASLQERAAMLVSPGDPVYEGMIVGENSRSEEMDVNVCREKKLTNMRAAGSDDATALTAPRPMSLENALEFIAGDECLEVTPETVRLRKLALAGSDRARLRKSHKRVT